MVRRAAVAGQVVLRVSVASAIHANCLADDAIAPTLPRLIMTSAAMTDSRQSCPINVYFGFEPRGDAERMHALR